MDPVIAKVEDVVISSEQRTAAEELRQAVNGDATQAVMLLMVMLQHSACNECTDFWWGVATSITHNVMVQITRERKGHPSAPIRHHMPDEGGTTH